MTDPKTVNKSEVDAQKRTDAPGGPPAEGDPDVAAWLTAQPDPSHRSTTLNVRLKPADRERLDQTARILGITTSAYVRSKLLTSGPDVDLWRGTYRMLLNTIEDAEKVGTPPASMAVLNGFKAEFERVAASVFSSGESS